MSRNGSFWRNAAIIGVVHAAVLFGLAHWSGSAKKPAATDILWMNGSVGAMTPAIADADTAALEIPEPTPAPSVLEEQPPEDHLSVPPVKSGIALPTPTPEPTATSTPRPTPVSTASPKATPKPTPKATPKPSPKKARTPNPSPTPRPPATPREKIETKKVAATPTPANTDADAADASPSKTETTPGASSQAAGAGKRGTGASAGGSQTGWYSNMLHDRFFGEWVQPKTAQSTGANMSTLVQLRIEQDGRVSDFRIVRSSGNVVVDESVAAVAKRVTRVDPPPAGFASGGHYDVRINFELTIEQ